MKCYVFVTDREFDRYRRPGVDTRYRGGQQSASEATGIGGSNRIRYKVFRDGDGLVVIIDGAEGCLITKTEVRKQLHPRADPEMISGDLIPYLSDVKSVINECVQDEAPIDTTLFTHWGGGMPQDVSAIERIVCKALSCCSLYDKWKTYSISSVRPEVFDISRGEILIPDLKECEEIASRADAYGGDRDWLNALALVCSSADPKSLIKNLPNLVSESEDDQRHVQQIVERIIERIGMVEETKDVCDFACQLVEEGAKGKNDLLALLASSDTVPLERCAALLAQLVDGEMCYA